MTGRMSGDEMEGGRKEEGGHVTIGQVVCVQWYFRNVLFD